MLSDEITTIFEKQKEFSNPHAKDELLQEFKNIAFTQRALKSVDDMVAKCPFETNMKRAPKASLTFETFRALQKLKNLRIISSESEKSLTQEETLQALHKAKNTKGFTYKTLKTLFSLGEDIQFKGLTYFDHKTGEVKEPEGAKLLDFSAYRKIKEAIQKSDNLYWDTTEENIELLDEIAKILSTQKDDKKSLEKLSKIIDNSAVCNALVGLSFSGFGHISVEAMRKINPYLLEGMDYDKACEIAGYDFKAILRGINQLFCRLSLNKRI